MILRRTTIALSCSALAWVAACGASPSSKPALPPEPPVADAGAPTKTEAGAASPGPAAGRTATDHHREFIGGCSKKPLNTPDYCECAWDQFRKAFTDDEMNAGDMPPPKLEKVKSQVATACASKIPEEAVKDGFSKSCIGQNPDMKTYCDCTWAEFRKRFSPAELSDEATVTSDKFTSSRATVVKTCGNKMPESVSKDAFMKGCTKDPAADKFCGCAWKELRKQASPAEIEAGTFDQKSLFAQVEKGCGKLRPPAAK